MSAWKDNPVIIAIASGSAVLIITLQVVFTYVIPVVHQDELNEIKTFKTENEKLTTEITSLRKKDLENTKKIKQHQNEVDSMNARFLEYSYHISFKSDSPYPLGYNKIKPGDNVDKIFEIYNKPEVKIRNENDYEVSPPYGIIGDITYNVNNKTKIITHITFHKRTVAFRDPDYEALDKISLSNILNNVFGKPYVCEDKNFKYWVTGNPKIVMYSLISDNYYVIYDKPYSPAIWPDDCSINS